MLAYGSSTLIQALRFALVDYSDTQMGCVDSADTRRRRRDPPSIHLPYRRTRMKESFHPRRAADDLLQCGTRNHVELLDHAP